MVLYEKRKISFVFVVALIIDLVIVGALKLAVRRPRPKEHDMVLTISLDEFSFPSGHATRAALVTVFLLSNFELPSWCASIILAWSVSVCLSRILLSRHHASDVVCGVLLGLVQYYFIVKYVWLSSDVCEKLIRPIQEELHL